MNAPDASSRSWSRSASEYSFGKPSFKVTVGGRGGCGGGVDTGPDRRSLDERTIEGWTALRLRSTLRSSRPRRLSVAKEEQQFEGLIVVAPWQPVEEYLAELKAEEEAHAALALERAAQPEPPAPRSTEDGLDAAIE